MKEDMRNRTHAPLHFTRFTQRLTAPTLIGLITFTAVTTVLVYFHVKTAVAADALETFATADRLEAERVNRDLTRAEATQIKLAKLLGEYLEEPSPRAATRFSTLFASNGTGEFHEKDTIDNRKHPSVIFDHPKTSERLRAVAYYDFLDRDCPAMLAQFSNCWVATDEGLFGMLYPTNDGYANRAEFARAKLISIAAETNSMRPHWSRAYLDRRLNKWMVSLVTPVFAHGRRVGSLGTDLVLGSLLEQTLFAHRDGTQNFIVSREGHLIAHAGLAEKLRGARKSINAIDLTDDLHVLLAAKTAADPQRPSADWLDSDDAFLGLSYLASADWYLVTTHPKSILTTAAADAGRLVVLWSAVLLVVEASILALIVRKRLARPLHQLLSVVERVEDGSISRAS